jgi:nucleotide-binding universal stress UspA family protein
MTTETHSGSEATTQKAQLFKRILVGIDHSPESVEAARQAAILIDPGGTLTLLSAWTVPPPGVGAFGTAFTGEVVAEANRESAVRAIATAEASLPMPAAPLTRVVRGVAWRALLLEIERGADSLVVVGSHGQPRLEGILLSSTPTEIVHKAPCSVLVARPADAQFPRRIVVGIDGSPQSSVAYATARRLAIRFDSEVWPVVAHGGKGLDRDRVAAIVDYHHEDLPDEPVAALVAASVDADLVVVGSRGLHGINALGSVSERVAHQVHCSTLVVR